MTLSLRRRQLYAGACGTALVLLLLLVASLDGMLFNSAKPEPLTVLGLQMYEAPPAPPQPPVSRSSGGGSSTPSLATTTTQSSGNELDIMELNADLRLAAGISGEFSSGFGGLAGNAGAGFGGTGDGLGSFEFALSDLEGLDSTPVVVYAETVDGRKFFDESGLDEFTVQFHIAIDETGKATPVRIVSNPLPELEEELLRFAARVRFTPPTRGGIPVRTEFLWPVGFYRQDDGAPQLPTGIRIR